MHSKLLDPMNNSKSITGEPMDRDLAVAQIIGVIWAGHETTANVIVECLYELLRYPDIQNKLRDELLAFARMTGREPTYDDLTSGTHLFYLDAVTRETMRTKAVLMTITREAVSEDKIPLHIPIYGIGCTHVSITPGQLVHVPVRDGINVDAAIWGSDGHEYRPERWLEDGGLLESVKNIHAPGHLMTFGDG
ncbi:hypothetical protein AcV7_000040 [Taiwanofungus camphoratus]|nr:hypothetical protein AcV7_000040 [Antrodia cinnamomea]